MPRMLRPATVGSTYSSRPPSPGTDRVASTSTPTAEPGPAHFLACSSLAAADVASASVRAHPASRLAVSVPSTSEQAAPSRA